MKKVVTVVLNSLMIALIFVGCSNRYEKELTLASEQLEIFKNGDMGEINRLLFPEDSVLTGETLLDELNTTIPNSKENSNGILGNIISMSAVEISDISDEEIQYIIDSLDLSNFFIDCQEELSMVSEPSAIADILLSYADKVTTTSTSINLSYEYRDDNLWVDYLDRNFINAMTGGLVGAYSDLYQKSLEEYKEALGS